MLTVNRLDTPAAHSNGSLMELSLSCYSHCLYETFSSELSIKKVIWLVGNSLYWATGWSWLSVVDMTHNECLLLLVVCSGCVMNDNYYPYACANTSLKSKIISTLFYSQLL